MIDLPQKIVCVGLNYRDHAEEQGVDLPERPLLFAKWPNTLIGPGEPIRVPSICKNPDYEAELGVVIGRRANQVSTDDALDFVRGYVVANDVSGRVKFKNQNFHRYSTVRPSRSALYQFCSINCLCISSMVSSL